MIRQIKIDLPPVFKLTLKQLRITIRPYSIIKEKIKLSGAIIGKDNNIKSASDTIEDKDNNIEPVNNTIENKDRDMAKPAEKIL